MGLARSMVIHGLEVNNSPWATIVFWCNDHPTCPVHWVIEANLLYHTQPHITGQASFDILDPVDRDLTGLVDSNRLGIFSNMEAERRGVLHQR